MKTAMETRLQNRLSRHLRNARNLIEDLRDDAEGSGDESLDLPALLSSLESLKGCAMLMADLVKNVKTESHMEEDDHPKMPTPPSKPPQGTAK